MPKKLSIIKYQLKYLKSKIDEYLQSYEFIGQRQNNDQLLPKFEELQSAIKQFLLEIKQKVDEVENKFNKIKGKSLPALELSIPISWEACQKHVESQISSIRHSHAAAIQDLPEDHQEFLKIIFDDVQETFQLEKSDAHEARIEFLTKQLNKTLIECAQIVKDKTPPSCFICYSWGNSANSKKIHKLAKLLKMAGVNVILDIWDNQSNSVAVFTAKLIKADFVIVMGAPSLKEKWENYVTQGESRGKQGEDYRCSVVCQELEKINGRINKKNSQSHGVMSLLLSGEHAESFPDPVETLASDALDFRDWNNLHVPLLNLLNIIYKKYEGAEAEIKRLRKNLTKAIDENKSNGEVSSHLPEKSQLMGDLDGFGSANFPVVENINFNSDYFSKITEHFKKTRIVALYGIQGVGKTYLALRYMAQVKDMFPESTRVYLNAQDQGQLEQQYLAIGESCGLALASYTPDIAVGKVTEYLNTKSGIFLFFDGARNRKEIMRFIPNSQGRVLVTTTSKTAYKPYAIEIKIMSETDAIQLVCTQLPDQSGKSNNLELQKFVTMLGCLPLAIVQACAYIRACDCSMADYCNYYEEQKRDALADTNGYYQKYGDHEPVYITWDLSFAAIDVKNKEAADILVKLACFQISGIDKTLLNDFFGINSSTSTSINLLVEYCMLERTEVNLILHTVLKDVVIEKQKEQKQHEANIMNLLARCQAKFNFTHYVDGQSLKKLQMLLPHAESILLFAIEEKINLQPVHKLIFTIARYYLDVFNNTKKASDYLALLNDEHIEEFKTKIDYLKSKIKLRQNKIQEAYDLLEPYINDRGKLTVYERCHLAQVLLRLKPTIQYPQVLSNANNSQIPSQEKKQDNIDEAETILTESLNLVKTDSGERAMVLHYLGNYQLIYKRNVKKALEHYQAALEIKKSLINNNREIARTHQQIGVCLFKQQEFKGALDNFKAAHDQNKGSLFANEILATLNKIVSTLYKIGLKQQDRAQYLNEMLDTLYEIKKLKHSLRNNYDRTCYLIAQICLNLKRKD